MAGERPPVVGVDLGTSESRVAVWKDGRVHIIPDYHTGKQATPSYVSVTDNNIYIGERAKEKMGRNMKNTVFGMKRLTGRTNDDTLLPTYRCHWPFKVSVTSGKAQIVLQIEGEQRVFNPERIMSWVLSEMMENADNFLGLHVTHAVMTVSTYFNEAQREQATRDVVDMASVSLLHVIDTSTAAAIAYCFQKNLRDAGYVLVYDIGTYAFEVSVLLVRNFTPIMVVSDNNDIVGSENFDRLIADLCLKEILKKYNLDLRFDAKAISKLLPACEEAKKTLSVQKEANIFVKNLFKGRDVTFKISRQLFEDLCSDMISTTLSVVDRALWTARIDMRQIKHVVLVGGSTRIPKLREMVKDYFKMEDLDQCIEPEEAVVYGAAIQGALLNGSINIEGVWPLINMKMTPVYFPVSKFLAPNIISNEEVPTVSSRHVHDYPHNKKQRNRAKGSFEGSNKYDQVHDNSNPQVSHQYQTSFAAKEQDSGRSIKINDESLKSPEQVEQTQPSHTDFSDNARSGYVGHLENELHQYRLRSDNLLDGIHSNSITDARKLEETADNKGEFRNITSRRNESSRRHQQLAKYTESSSINNPVKVTKNKAAPLDGIRQKLAHDISQKESIKKHRPAINSEAKGKSVKSDQRKHEPAHIARDKRKHGAIGKSKRTHVDKKTAEIKILNEGNTTHHPNKYSHLHQYRLHANESHNQFYEDYISGNGILETTGKSVRRTSPEITSVPGSPEIDVVKNNAEIRDYISFKLDIRYEGGILHIPKKNMTTPSSKDMWCMNLGGNLVSITLPARTFKTGKNDSTRSESKVGLTLKIDANGIIDIKSPDQRSVKLASNRDVSEMRKELQTFRDKEVTIKNRDVAKTNLENYVYKLKQAVEDESVGTKVSEEEKKRVKDECERMLDFLDENDMAEESTFVSALQAFKKMFRPLVRILIK